MDRDRKRILVVGGTHGNEKSGIWTVEEMLHAPEAWEFPGLEVQPLLANPLVAVRTALDSGSREPDAANDGSPGETDR